jgi:oxaloacetate decarboxylase (Na+ extruding) subunit alpha
MSEVRFVDTTLRDGQQSLWALNMRTGMMLPIAAEMDRAGFDAIELGTPIEIPKCVRELREDPWERNRLLAQRITETPLRAIHGTSSGFEKFPHAIHRLWDERVAACGLKQVRISDCWNDPSGWRWRIEQARAAGLEPIINLIYSVSPKHTDDYYAERTRAAAGLGVFRLCLKDPGGLLTPERTRTLVPAILANANGIPVELHTHCTTGLGTLCCLEAIQLGILTINTAVPPLADGSSNPSIFGVARNARAMGHATDLDEAAVRPVADHFTALAKRERLPIGAPPEYDEYQYLHQVPGGMISNLRYQLKRVGMEDRLGRTLEEAAQVRADLGYPIMVTPLSQFVGSQAAINVIVGERYKQVTDQVIQYALAHWGKEGAASMDPNVKDKVLGQPRAKELASWEPPQPSLEELRSKFGGPGVTDDELLLRYIAGKDEVEAMRAAGPPREYLSARHPLVALIEELSKRRECRQIHIRKGELSLHLEKRAG